MSNIPMYSPEFQKFWSWYRDKPRIREMLDTAVYTKEIAYEIWQEAIRTAPTKVRTEIVYRNEPKQWIATGDEM